MPTLANFAVRVAIEYTRNQSLFYYTASGEPHKWSISLADFQKFYYSPAAPPDTAISPVAGDYWSCRNALASSALKQFTYAGSFIMALCATASQ